MYNPIATPTGKVLGASVTGVVLGASTGTLPQTSRLPFIGTISVTTLALAVLSAFVVWTAAYFIFEKASKKWSKKN